MDSKRPTTRKAAYSGRPYRYNTIGDLDWESETTCDQTWGIFRSAKTPLCLKCRTKGVGARSPVGAMRPPSRNREGKIVDYLGWEWVHVSLLSKIRSAGFGSSSGGGCAFCMIVYLGFRQLERARYGSGVEPSGDWDLRYALQSPRCVRVGAVHWASGDGEVVDQFYITLEGNMEEDDVRCRSQVPSLHQAQDRDRSSLRPEWIPFMRTRLDNCMSSADHKLCRREPNFQVEWPRRMLKMTGEKVILTDFDQTMAGKYAALSYCWGGTDELKENPPLVATSSNFSQLQSGIPVSDLPLTIRQAVAVCSYLNINYIWVDALCIIQDDKTDWDTEARKMATVYSMAKLTIIAASSTSCHSGFLDVNLGGEPFNPQFPDELDLNLKERPFRLVARRSNLSSFHFEPQDFANFDPTYVETPVEPQDPIEHRGWTYQEEFLSTRSIRFTKDDIQWQCREDAGCLCQQGVQKHERRALDEDLWAEQPETETDSPRHQAASSQKTTANQPPPSILSFLPTSRDYWNEIVLDFSRRKFTRPSADKLIAFSGIASRLAANMQSLYTESTFIAGLWSNMLLDGGALSWRCRENDALARGRRAYDTYVAPSFSWASLDEGVIYDQGSISRNGFSDERRLFDLVGTERIPFLAEPPEQGEPDSEFGRVGEGCSVTLSGVLLLCTVGHGPGGRRPSVGRIQGFRDHGWSTVEDATWFDCDLSRVTLPDGTVTVQRRRCSEGLDDGTTTITDAIGETGAFIFILRSMTFYSGSGSGFEGLVLGRMVRPGGVDGYQRLGYLRLKGRSSELDLEMDKSVVTIY